MASSYIFFFLVIFKFLTQQVNSSNCSLDFSRFPYEAHAECLDIASSSLHSVTSLSCCRSALFSLFQAIAIKSNQSRSILLEPVEAEDCANRFQSLHNRTNFSKCELQNYISYSVKNYSSKDSDSVINLLGVDKFTSLKTNCSALSSPNYGDESCLNCALPFKESLRSLRESDEENTNECDGALLISLASLDVNTPQWIHGTFSCLWNEIELSPRQKHDGFLMGSKKLFAIMIVAAVLVLLAPVLFALTKKSLRDKSNKEIQDLSVIILKNSLEDDMENPFNCSDLYLFSQFEIMRATNGFDDANLIREGDLGKVYVGTMPSGMRAEIFRISKGMEVHRLVKRISSMAKIRHPHLVSIMGYCIQGEHCLVSDYCANGDLASWLCGERRKLTLSWEQRVRISIGISQGLWFLHNNNLEKIVHGDIKVRDTIAKGGKLSTLADPNLNGEFVLSEFQHILLTAVLCTADRETDRPKMDEVLQKLEKTHLAV